MQEHIAAWPSKYRTGAESKLFSQTPRHYVVRDSPDMPRRAEEQYSYSYTNEATSNRAVSSIDPRTYRPEIKNSSHSSESVSRNYGTGPGSNYSYSTERSSRSGDGPGSYHSSYSSTTSGRLPGGTTYRHFSYRV